MKFRLVLPAALILLLLAALPAWGQGNSPELALSKANVSVAFDFWVNDQHLPAGDYVVQCDPLTQLMLVRNRDTGDQALVFTNDVVQSSDVAETRLVFAQSGQRYVLHQVWIEGDRHSHNVRHGPEVPELPED